MDAWQNIIAEMNDDQKRELLQLVESSLHHGDVDTLYEYADEPGEPQLSEAQLWGSAE